MPAVWRESDRIDDLSGQSSIDSVRGAPEDQREREQDKTRAAAAEKGAEAPETGADAHAAVSVCAILFVSGVISVANGSDVVRSCESVARLLGATIHDKKSVRRNANAYWP